MTQAFVGKTALITGGGTGIGQAAAIQLAGKGCLVTVAGRTISTLEETVREIEAAGGKARSIVCDVSDEASVKAAVKAAIGDSGRLDFGINSAGVTGEDDLRKTGDYVTETFDHVITIDL